MCACVHNFLSICVYNSLRSSSCDFVRVCVRIFVHVRECAIACVCACVIETVRDLLLLYVHLLLMCMYDSLHLLPRDFMRACVRNFVYYFV